MGQARMLRITLQEGESAQTIKLEGEIVGPWVEELNRSWRSLAPSLSSKQLHLDLCAVAFVDAKGRQLLREIYQKANARFVADSPLTRYFADDAMRRSPKAEKKESKNARSLWVRTE
jgi:ABC-type transporter Mla MlaB component